MSLFELEDGTPLRHDEALAYVAEKAWRAKEAAEERGDSTAIDLHLLWVRADGELWDVVGHEGYDAALAWVDSNFDLVRVLPRRTLSEQIADRMRDRLQAVSP